jgi:hypothetical protein
MCLVEQPGGAGFLTRLRLRSRQRKEDVIKYRPKWEQEPLCHVSQVTHILLRVEARSLSNLTLGNPSITQWLPIYRKYDTFVLYNAEQKLAKQQ